VGEKELTNQRLDALEDVVFADDTNIGDALVGMLSLIQHLAFVVGDTFHDLSHSFAGGTEHIGKLLDQTDQGDESETDDGPLLAVVRDEDEA
tara:strand:+ start:112 stop:387 length:276 start_codon:yes stop_codon:yes gene_type:complete